MGAAALEQRWPREAEAAPGGFKAWRWQHPRAALGEIGAVPEERLARLRARPLEDAALARAAADPRARPAEDRPRCP